MLDRLEFLLGEALTALKRNGMMTISAINTAAIALFFFGGLGYVYVSLAAHLDSLQSEFVLRISIKDGATKSAMQQMAKDLRAIDGVSAVTLHPKGPTWRKFVQKLESSSFFEDQPNPLPDQFEIQLADLAKADSVKEAVSKHPTFDPKDEIRDARSERAFVISLIGFVRVVGGLLSVISFFTAGTLIFNTVHLTVVARRNQIRTMALVGASPGTVRWPFLLEGSIQGLAGGLVAGLLLWAIAAYIRGRSAGWFGFAGAAATRFPGWETLGSLMAIGLLLGMLSAALSVRRYLRTDA